MIMPRASWARTAGYILLCVEPGAVTEVLGATELWLWIHSTSGFDNVLYFPFVFRCFVINTYLNMGLVCIPSAARAG